MHIRFWQYFLAAGLNQERAREFLGSLGSYVDPLAAFLSWPRLPAESRAKIDRLDLKRLEKAIDQGVQIVTPDRFPPQLHQLERQPYAFFTWGDSSVLHEPSLAIVGTRGASAYGQASAKKFAEHLAARGITIISGGALGIDAAAHKGAIEVKGATAAVLGTGIDRVFPSSHGELFKSIREFGCLVSQYPIGTPSIQHHFLERNQMIAALCSAVLVVEAPLRSGSLSTARAALDMGKEIFVVPGSIAQQTFKGSHALIRDGATLVDHPDHILEAMGWSDELKSQAEKVSDTTPTQSLILGCLGAVPRLPEAFAEETGLSTSDLLAELTMLEIDGLVIKDASGYALKP